MLILYTTEIKDSPKCMNMLKMSDTHYEEQNFSLVVLLSNTNRLFSLVNTAEKATPFQVCNSEGLSAKWYYLFLILVHISSMVIR